MAEILYVTVATYDEVAGTTRTVYEAISAEDAIEILYAMTTLERPKPIQFFDPTC